MLKARLLLILGVWVAVLPYLGFPSFLKNILFSLSGLGLIYFSYLLYQEWKREEDVENKDKKQFDNFSENVGFSQVSGEATEETSN